MNINNPPPKKGLVLPGKKKAAPSSDADYTYFRHLPFLHILPDGMRNHFVAMSGEFVGTFLFLFFAFSGTQVANTKAPGGSAANAPDTSQLLYVSLCFGFSLATNAWIFFRISGGLFNPAVSLLFDFSFLAPIRHVQSWRPPHAALHGTTIRVHCGGH